MDKENLFTAEDIEKGFYPLRPMQRWLIDTHFNKAKSTMMNIGFLLKMSPELDPKQLEKAINEILDTYDIFKCRLVFHPETGELCQRFDGEVQHVTVEHWSDEEFELFRKFLQEPYMLINKPLYRSYIFETPSANYFYMDFYHAIMDGTSLAMLFAHEMDVRYQGKKIKRVPSKYADYVAEEMKIPAEELEAGNNYWREITKIFDEKKHLPPVDVQNGGSWRENIVEHNFKNVTEKYFANKIRREHIFFLAASMLTLAKISGAKSSMLSWVHNGRMTVQERRLMGIMLEQYPISWNFETDMTVSDFLDKVEIKVNEEVIYRKSLASTYWEGSQDDCATFLFQKNFHADEIFVDGKSLKAVEFLPNAWSAVENSLDIEVNLTDAGNYYVELDYDASRYSEQSMKNFAEVMDEIILQLQDEKLLISKILE